MDTRAVKPRFLTLLPARVAELADAVDSKSTDESLVGSTPTPGTTFIGEGKARDGNGTTYALPRLEVGGLADSYPSKIVIRVRSTSACSNSIAAVHYSTCGVSGSSRLMGTSHVPRRRIFVRG